MHNDNKKLNRKPTKGSKHLHSFTTERLLIRPIQAQDQALYISLYTDAKIMQHIGAPLSLQAAEKAFNSTLNVMNKVISSAANKAKSKKKPKTMTWVMVTLDNQQSIGIQALHWQGDDCAEIGIMLLNQTKGKGLATEAMSTLIKYGFEYYGLNTINIRYFKENFAMTAIAKKMGFINKANAQVIDEKTQYQYINKHSWQNNMIKTIDRSEFHER